MGFFFFLSFINFFNKHLSQILSWELGKLQRIRPMWSLLNGELQRIPSRLHATLGIPWQTPVRSAFRGGNAHVASSSVGSDGHCARRWAAGWGWGSLLCPRWGLQGVSRHCPHQQGSQQSPSLPLGPQLTIWRVTFVLTSSEPSARAGSAHKALPEVLYAV